MKLSCCIYPCSGQAVLRTRPGSVPLAADKLPVWMQCSECGCAPSPTEQPELVAEFLREMVKRGGLS